jgi:hypothetical protein
MNYNVETDEEWNAYCQQVNDSGDFDEPDFDFMERSDKYHDMLNKLSEWSGKVVKTLRVGKPKHGTPRIKTCELTNHFDDLPF